jgi:serine/threonine-protein kinase HipA
MKPTKITRVAVSLDFGDQVLKVGRLALVRNQIYFEYDSSFLATGLEISPFRLPLKPGAVTVPWTTFEGLFGVFNDSLPDGWGRLLLDRQVRKHGVLPDQLTALDRLAHVGASGMGALVYEPDFSQRKFPERVDLDHLAERVSLIEGESEEVFEELLSMSGSSAGARPKVVVGVSPDRSTLVHGLAPLPDGYEPWLIKFNSCNDSSDMGAIEYAYSLLAKEAGLEVMPTHLFPSSEGAGYFGVKRFDRVGSSRLHMHTISGLVHSDHRMPSLDYDDILRATLALTRNHVYVEQMYRLAIFNVLAHNRDDHSKNFAFLMNSQGIWKPSPAYDLTFSSGPNGWHCTTVCGEGESLGVEQLRLLAERFSISRADAQIDQVRQAIAKWPTIAKNVGVSKTSIREVSKQLLFK